MNIDIQKLTSLEQELQQLVILVPWSEKHKIIEIKNKAKLLAEFVTNDPNQASEVEDEIKSFMSEVDQLIIDLNTELTA